MTVRLVKPRDPRQLPEFTLWRMMKDGRAVEARVRIVPLDEGRPEIRILFSRQDGTFDLLWSQVFTDGRDINELAQQKQREFEVRGWTLACAQCCGTRWVCEQHAHMPFPHETCGGPGVPCPACQPPGERPELPDDWRSLASTDE